MKLGIIVQARIASTRLPEKIILPINEGEQFSFLDLLLTKLNNTFSDVPIVLATSIEEQNDVLQGYAQKHNVQFFRGSENNVLKRFVDCAKTYEFDTLVRICSDNPFLDIDLLLELINKYTNEDYFSYRVNGKPSILTHYGFFGEIVKLSALERVLQNGKKECFEHVTNCIYNDGEHFNVNFENIKIEEQYIRCTLDTPLDFENLQFIYKHWYLSSGEKGYKSLLNFISSKVNLIENMKTQILKNSK